MILVSFLSKSLRFSLRPVSMLTSNKYELLLKRFIPRYFVTYSAPNPKKSYSVAIFAKVDLISKGKTHDFVGLYLSL